MIVFLAKLMLVGACFAAMVACHARPPSEKAKRSSPPSASGGAGDLAVIDLTKGAPESSGGAGLFPLPAAKTYVGLVRALERLTRTEEVQGVFVSLGSERLGWAKSEEVGRLLSALPESMSVTCHAHGLSNSTLWLMAHGCDERWLSPAGDVDSVGIAAEVVYLRSALERLGIETDFLSMGRYKSAAEQFTRDGPSPAASEALTATLGSIRTTWLAGLVQSYERDGVRWLAEHGPFGAREAKVHALIDHVGYESEARESAMQRAGADATQPVFPPGKSGGAFDFTELVRLLSGVDDEAGGRPSIVVVPAVGAIAMGGGGPLGGGGILSAALTKTIRRLREDDSVRAVVLRIDSPGGSALASDLLWHELRQLRDEKPLIASVGGMAASGGYYLACAADTIFAERTSIVGSIGVVGGKVVFGPALAELGVTTVIVPASGVAADGARAAYNSPLIPWNASTRERVRTQMQSIYDLFVDRVAEGRRLPRERVLAVAEGRIWSARQGKENGLVDEFGGLQAALKRARERAHLDDDAPVIVESGVETLLESLLLNEDAEASQIEAALRRSQAERAPWSKLLSPGLLPYAQSLAPLARGERVVAAAPQAILIR